MSKSKTNIDNYSYVIHSQEGYTITKKKFKGHTHIIVPVVMMMEGVHNGSHGPLFHPIDELGKFPNSWNGIPIVINHPEKDGLNVSANYPDILETLAVGQVFNTHVEDMKLKAEAWLDEIMLKDCSLDLYNRIMENKAVEVSVGVYTDDEKTPGVWNGEEYTAVATNHRPDHLALLTEVVGACSFADGCGIRANQTNEDMKMNIKGTISGEDLRTTMVRMNEGGFSMSRIGNYLSAGYMEKISAVHTVLRGMDNNDAYYYLEDMDDDVIVYAKNSGSETSYYKQSYTFESGKIKLSGLPVSVHKKVEYINTNVKLNKEVSKMSKTNECPKCLEKVNALIANKDSKFTEVNREWLLTQDEATLDLLAPTVVEVEKEKVVEKTVEVNKLTPEDQAALAFGKKQLKERREGMIKTILDNTENVWTEERLNKMDDDILEGISKSVARETEAVTDYSVRGSTLNANTKSGVAPLYPIGIKMEDK